VLYAVNTPNDVRIKSLRYTASSSTWGGAQFIAPDTTFSIQEAQLAVASNGNAVAIWSQSDGTNTNAVANYYDASVGTWGTARIIDTTVAGDTVQPAVGIDKNGNAWAIWARIGSTSQMWANHFAAGTGWGTVQVFNTIAPFIGRYPQVAFDVSGNVMAVWTQRTLQSNYMQILASYNTSGTWGAAQVIETLDGDSSDPQIVFDAAGNATAVWDKSDVFPGVNVTLWSNRFE
jgi:hypothetical protein